MRGAYLEVRAAADGLAQRWILARAVGRGRDWEQQEQRQQYQRSDSWGAERRPCQKAQASKQLTGHACKVSGHAAGKGLY